MPVNNSISLVATATVATLATVKPLKSDVRFCSAQ